MRNFEEQIKETYKELQVPEFSEAAWDKFQTHGDVRKKKSNKNVLLWLSGILLLVCTSTYGIYQMSFTQENEVKTEHLSIKSNNLAELESKAPVKTLKNIKNISSDQLVTTPKLQEQITAQEKDHKSLQNSMNGFNPIAKKNIVSKPQDQASHEILNQENQNFIEKDRVASIDLTIEKQVKRLDQGEVQRNLPENIIPLSQAIQPLLVNFRDLKMNDYLEPIVPVQGKKIAKGFSYGLSGSLGYLDHSVIESNSIRNIQNGIYFNYGKYIRLKADLGMDNITYDTRIFSLNLGIEGRVAESRSLKFQKVENEVNKIELGLGIDLISPAIFGTSIIAGPSLVYGREISRSLSYQFEDQETMAMETLLEDNYELQKYPLNLRYDVGIRHSITNKYSLQFILSSLKQLNKAGYDMPNETTYALGIEIKL